MHADEILSRPTRVLPQHHREHYFKHGYTCVESFVPKDILQNLIEVKNKFVDASRGETESGSVYDLGPAHSPEKPQLRRLKRPDDQHDVFWNFAKGLLADVATDLLGPDVAFYHSKLNFKWAGGSDAVKWHQDAQFVPHTNYNVIYIGTYLADTGMDNGPLALVKDSHEGPLYDLYGEDGEWNGCLNDDDAAEIDMSKVAYLTGPAGTITIHNCRSLHFSPDSISPNPRPLLLNCFTAANSKPYTPHPEPTSHSFQLVRGKPARWAELDPRPCQIPPDWSRGFTTIFENQEGTEA